MSKRILSLVLTLALILGSFSMAFADTATTTSSKTMTDVEGTQYEKAVLTLGKLKVLEGYTDGTFKPGNTITRAEFAAVASRIRGLEAAAQNSKGATEFKDVPASHWASGYVNVASKNGLIKGMGNGQFAPEAPITYEQAITMIVRALGYEYAAQSLGGYPVGYLSVASQEQLLRGINEGSQGAPASRGLVALLLNNALDIPKMIQVGYGDQAKWIQSGTENTDKKFLFEDLGLKQLDKAQVTKVDSKKQQVTLERKAEFKDERDIKIGLKADKDFNYSGFEGLRVTAWYNDRTDELVVCKDDGAYKAKYDVIEKTSKANEIKLVKADEKVDVDSKAKSTLDGKSVNVSDYTENSNTYAKVIVNEYGDVNWIEAYSLNDEIVVNKVEKNLIKGYDRREISDANDYTIIKDGKQISASDLKEKDLLIYNSKSEVAVVITDIRTGKIDTVYKSGFKFEGKTYDNDVKDLGFVQYIVEDNLEDVTQEVLEEMQKNGEVKVYFSFNDKPLFIDGKAEEVASNYVMLESNTSPYRERTTDYMSIDVLNSEGKVVKYGVDEKDIKDASNKIFKTTATDRLQAWKDAFKKGEVIKITTDADNKLTKVETVAKTANIKNVEIDDTYLAGSRLQSNTVVFMANGESKVKDFSVIKWADAKKEFKKVLTGDAYTFDGKVVAIFANTTDGDESTEAVVGVLKKAQETIKGSRYELKVEVNGKETDYVAKNFSAESGKTLAASGLIGMEDKVVVLDVTKGGNEIKKWNKPSSSDMRTGLVTKATSGRIELKDHTIDYIVEGEYYNKGFKGDVKPGDVLGKNVILYMQPGSDRYVQVVELGTGGTGGIGAAGKVTYKNTTSHKIEVEGVVYTITANSILRNAEGTIIADTITNIEGKLTQDVSKVYDIVANADKEIASFKLQTAAADKLSVANITGHVAGAAIPVEIKAIDSVSGAVDTTFTKTISVVLSNGVTLIKDVAFVKGVGTITIPAATVTSIGTLSAVKADSTGLTQASFDITTVAGKAAAMTLNTPSAVQYVKTNLTIGGLTDGTNNITAGNYVVKVVSDKDGEVFNASKAVTGGAVTGGVDIVLTTVGTHTLTVTVDGFIKTTTATITADITKSVWSGIKVTPLNTGNITINKVGPAAVNEIFEAESGVKSVVINIAGTDYTGTVNAAGTQVSFTGLPTVTAGVNYTITITDNAGNVTTAVAVVLAD